MKILFTCGCLEPGLDGVGDYTRRLAAELRIQGHDCHLLAVADGHVKQPVICEFREKGAVVSALRLPGILPWPARTRLAREYCEQFAPDWISWQIVPYGFHPRGLSLGLGGHLREISRGYQVEIMFHEIWIGLARQSKLQHKLVGQVQRHILRDVLKKTQPLVVHTHTPLYRHLLEKIGHGVVILPLFGNIPIAPAAETEWLKRICPENGEQFLADRGQLWVFAIFGSIHPEWDAEDFRRRATDAARKAGKKCRLIAIGRPGGAGEQKLRELERNQDEEWQVISLGQQSEAEISQCLLAADFGVSSVPPENVFKSGTIAAMGEHGLQVLVTRLAAHYSGCSPEQLVAGMHSTVTDFDQLIFKKTEMKSLLPLVAGQFIDDLQKASFRRPV